MTDIIFDFFIGAAPIMLLVAYLTGKSMVHSDKPEATKREQVAVVAVLYIMLELALIGLFLAVFGIGLALCIPRVLLQPPVIIAVIILFYFVAKAIINATYALIKFILKISH